VWLEGRLEVIVLAGLSDKLCCIKTNFTASRQTLLHQVLYLELFQPKKVVCMYTYICITVFLYLVGGI
jgi:hypothetical protein